ncbi:hypothetical protein [Bosea sp. (in: a-proteobacteria)]|uniref:hypothetical protein n=1 Tax=Bosea sp. (in: a-proteobacteria) TaxID=1871050 RepID=UPI002FC9B22A
MKRLALPAILSSLLLASCTTGDLGRPRPNYFSDQLAPAIGDWTARFSGEASSWFHLTDDEKQLRARAWRLVMPAYELNVFEREVSSLFHARVLPAQAQSGSISDYHRGLVSGSFASQASRYNRLAEDANADRALLAPFRANAIRVVNADRARLRTLDASPRVPADSREPAQARVIENEGLILWVCDRLGFRLSSYRYALDNLVVEMPSREAVRAERAIMGLEAEIGLVCKLPLIGVFGGKSGSEGAPQPDRPVVYKG